MAQWDWLLQGILPADNGDPATGQQLSPAEEAESRPNKELDLKKKTQSGFPWRQTTFFSLATSKSCRCGEGNGTNITIGSQKFLAKWWNWGPERWHELSETTQQVTSRDLHGTQSISPDLLQKGAEQSVVSAADSWPECSFYGWPAVWPWVGLLKSVLFPHL